MSKDPAFLFYPNDYIGGTMGMTFEEKGAYIELLMLQFNRGHMTSHMAGQMVGQLWDKIKDKFIQDEDGLYYNARLETEIEKRKEFCNSRRNNINGTNQYTKSKDKNGGHMEGHVTSHMENEDVNGNIIKIDYEFIINLYHNLCPKMAKVVKLTDKRKGFVNARIAEFGIDKITEALRKSGQSDFLNGQNDRAWKADFEWIMRPENFVKILECKYDNKITSLKVAM